MIRKMIGNYYTGLFSINAGLHSSDKSARWRQVGIPIIIFISFISIYGTYIAQLYGTLQILKTMDMVPQLLTLGVFYTLMLSFIGATARSCNILFLSRDLPFWLAAPISTRTLVFGKTLIASLVDMVASVLFIAPALLMVGIELNASPLFYVLGTVGAVVLPIPTFLLGTIVGLLLQLAFKGLKSKQNLLKLFFGLAGTMLIVVGSFFLGTEAAANLWRGFIDFLSFNRFMALVTEPYMNLLFTPSIIRIVLFFVIYVALFVAFVELISKFYFHISEIFNRSRGNVSTKVEEFKTKSAASTLFQRELKRYVSSTIYVLNTAIGHLMLLAAAIFLVVNSGSVALYLPMIEAELGMAGMAVPLVAIAAAGMISMSPTTSSAISLEGKNLDLLKSFPVTANQIFVAKLRLNLTLNAIALLIALPLLFWALPFTAVEMLLTTWLVAAYGTLTPLVGLIANLLLPKFDWQNETQVIKQSAAVMFSVFGNMIAIVPMVALMMMTNMSVVALLLLFAIVFTFICVGLAFYLFKAGPKRFENL